MPLHISTADDAEKRAREAELKFIAAQKRKAEFQQRVQDINARLVDSVHLDGIQAGHVQRAVAEAERGALQQNVRQAEKDEEKLFLEMQLAREAFKKANAERQSEQQRHAEVLASVNAQKDEADEFNRARRALNARLSRTQLEEQRRQAEAAMEAIDHKYKAVLAEHQSRLGQQKAALEAKKREARAHAEQARQDAIQQHEAFKRREEERRLAQTLEESRLKQQQDEFRNQIQQHERELKEKRDKRSARPSQSVVGFDDPDLAQHQSRLDSAYRLLSGAEVELTNHLARGLAEQQALEQWETDQLARIRAAAAAQEARDAEDMAQLEKRQHELEQQAQAQAREHELQTQTHSSRIIELTKQVRHAVAWRRPHAIDRRLTRSTSRTLPTWGAPRRTAATWRAWWR